MIAVREWARRNARPSAVAMALVITAVVVALGDAVGQTVDGSPFHLASQLAGSDARFREILGASAYRSLSEGQVYGSLVLDGVLAVVYGFGLWFFLWTYWCQPFFRSRVCSTSGGSCSCSRCWQRPSTCSRTW